MKQWDYNDHNEIYLIKPESLKKSYDNIVRKLQKERVKFIKKNQGQLTQEDEIVSQTKEGDQQIEVENKELKESFSFMKDAFTKKHKTRTYLLMKQQNLKRKFEEFQEEIQEEQIKNLKDIDVAHQYNYERQKYLQMMQNNIHKKI